MICWTRFVWELKMFLTSFLCFKIYFKNKFYLLWFIFNHSLYLCEMFFENNQFFVFKNRKLFYALWLLNNFFFLRGGGRLPRSFCMVMPHLQRVILPVFLHLLVSNLFLKKFHSSIICKFVFSNFHFLSKINFQNFNFF